VSFGVGYSIPALTILLALLIFSLPNRLYYKQRPQGSVLLEFAQICALKVMRRDISHSSDRVHDVENVLSILPFWVCFIVYFSVWSQLTTLIYAQGCQMDARLAALDMDVPIAALSLFSIIPILVLIPLLDRCLFPWLRRRCGLEISMLQKMGAGFLFASLSMIAVDVTEIVRRDYSAIDESVASVCDGDDVFVSELSIFWQIPAFVLEGVSEVLAAVTGYEFFFNEAPASMKSVVSALYTMSIGLGSWITGIYIVAANADSRRPWITDDLNDGHLDWYFFCIAAFMFAASLFFVYHARGYQYNEYGKQAERTLAEAVAMEQVESKSMAQSPTLCKHPVDGESLSRDQTVEEYTL